MVLSIISDDHAIKFHAGDDFAAFTLQRLHACSVIMVVLDEVCERISARTISSIFCRQST